MEADEADAAIHAATAENLAGWHEASVEALGLRSQRTADAWWTLEPAPPMYFPYITLRRSETRDHAALRSRHAADVLSDRSRFGGLCDPWRTLDMSAAGFCVGDDHPWMVRNAAVGGAPRMPADLEVARVRDIPELREFEEVTVAGFEIPPAASFALHAPPILRDRRFGLWVGRVDGRAVTASMSFLHAGVLGVYGVATVPYARRKGYGAAMTWAALSADPTVPSVLQPSAMGEAIYRRLGYERFTTFATWFRRPEGDTA